ncbi:MAG TPA: hypothetical protein VMN38_05225 [Sphingomicrobium sp.]|nr:hypothetical protein [Sphingomicrobium sp.]
MKLAPSTLRIVAFALALAACGGSDPVADEAENTAGLPSDANVAGAQDGTPSADGSAPANVATAPATAAPVSAAAIPAALHGRWGMTPADCTSTRGDAKGLLVVSADRLTFYESRAIPARNVEASDDSIRADFDFVGEGQTWTKYQALALQDDRLVRTESSPMASFTYVRCG